MTCLRCAGFSYELYCDHCQKVIAKLEEQWYATFYDLFQDLLPHVKNHIHELDERGTPTALEVMIESMRKLTTQEYRYYHKQLHDIYEEYVEPQPGEFPTERELREAYGDRKYHEMKEEGRLAR